MNARERTREADRISSEMLRCRAQMAIADREEREKDWERFMFRLKVFWLAALCFVVGVCVGRAM